MTKKSHFGPNLGSLGSNLGRQFFFKKLTLSVTRYHGQLSLCTKSKELNDPILTKFSGGRTDGRTDRQKDESDFIGRCLINVSVQHKLK